MKYLLTFFLLFSTAYSQTSIPYSFSFESNAQYEEITGGVISTVTGNDGGENIRLPFVFFYGGLPYITARISVNGWLAIGNSYSGTGWSNDLASTSQKPLVAPLWDDLNLDAQTVIRYESFGVAPNRRFVIQWKNILWRSVKQNFQIILYESTNIISFVYGNMTQPSGASASIGINDTIGGPNRFISVTPAASPTYSTTQANNSINSIAFLSGYKYNFTPVQQSPEIILQQNTQNIAPASTNQIILRVKLFVPGPLPLNPEAHKLYFSTLGTSNNIDILNAKLYYTGKSANFNTTNQHGNTMNNPSGNFTIDGVTALEYGENYFWLTYDISPGAQNGNLIDATCDSIQFIGIPENSNPTGARTVVQGISGTLTIGATGTYQTLGSALNALNTSALSGPVTLLIQNDYSPVNEAFPIQPGNIPGASSSNTLTIRPASDVTSLTIEASSTAIFEFVNSEFIIIDGRPLGNDTLKALTIINNQSTGNTLRFLAGNYGCTVKFATILGRNSSTTGGTIHFMGDDISANYEITLEKLIIKNSAAQLSNTGIYVSGNYRVPSQNFRLYDLEISNFHDAGIYLHGGTEGTIIERCSFTHTQASASSTVYGIRLDHAHNTIVRNNKIYGLKTAHQSPTTVNGIFIIGSFGLPAHTLIYNNFISLTDNLDCTVNGIDYNGYPENSVEIYFNSINMFGSGSLSHSSSGISKRGAALNFAVQNNIIQNERVNSGVATGNNYGLNYSNKTGLFKSDFNNVMVPSGTYNHFGNWGGAVVSSLANWKSVTQVDFNTTGAFIHFLSPSNLRIADNSAGDLNLMGTAISGIQVDIDYQFRHPSAPYKGADERTDYPLPVELSSFLASVNGNQIYLNWETATESNNYGFAIERKSLNSDWISAGFVQGKGNSTVPVKYTFSEKLHSGQYFYRLKQIDLDGTASYSLEISVTVTGPNKFELSQNYPNPVFGTTGSSKTKISFNIPENSLAGENKITLTLYDVSGAEVMILYKGDYQPGYFEIEPDLPNLPSGIYIYRLNAGEYLATKKMMIIK
ncbi:MAG: T9SS type A sorting domain-containing protein [Ignavibacteriaceae bacterium]|nr:T9SS type A sorting domain-containing protein [Ignavibacteriaceae bacterium]